MYARFSCLFFLAHSCANLRPRSIPKWQAVEQMSGARVVLIVPASSFPNISSSFLANNSIMGISSSPPWHLCHGVTKSSECHPISEDLTTRFAKKNSFRETKVGIIKVKLKLKKKVSSWSTVSQGLCPWGSWASEAASEGVFLQKDSFNLILLMAIEST